MNSYRKLISKARRDLFLKKLSVDEEVSVENENLRIIAAMSLPLALLECIFLAGSVIYYYSTLKDHIPSLISIVLCAVICLLLRLVSSKLIRQRADKKKIRLLIACAYWIFCLWGIWGSVRHYQAGSQMILFDSVQICFALLLFVPPFRAAFRVLCSYSIQLFIIWKVDRAAGIAIIDYYMMAFLILTGYVVRYLQKKRSLLQNARIIEKNGDLAFDSTHDSLTGMKNRMALRKDFPNYVGKTLYVIMVDVDKFKQYNDWYGHEVGDQVLAGIGKQILDLFGYDYTYRYGGDEFLLILQKSLYEEMHELLLVWEQDVALLEIEGLNTDTPIHCSYGIAEGKAESMETLRSMILEADSKMYRMKRRRNT